MSPTQILTLIAVVIGAVGHLLLASYYYGKLTQASAEHSRQIARLESSDQRQWQTLDEHGKDIVRLKTKVDTLTPRRI